MLGFFSSLYPYMIESFVVLNEECHLSIFKMIRKKTKRISKKQLLESTFFFWFYFCV